MKTTPYLIFFIITIGYIQNNWQTINEYDLKFKLPNGYNFKDTPKAKIYSYQDDSKIISLSIFENNTVKKLEKSDRDELKRYYKGFVDSYLDKAGSKVLSRDTYEIEDKLAYKITSEILYQDGSKNLLDIHILYKNGLDYFATFQYDSDTNQNVIKDKNNFFYSFTFKTMLDNTKKKEENKMTPPADESYQTGKSVGRILSYVLGIGFIVFIIYLLFYKKKKSTV